MPSTMLASSRRPLLATSLLVLLAVCCCNVQPAHSAAIAPGRYINQDHDKLFAEMEQAQKLKKVKERKPVSAGSGGADILQGLSRGGEEGHAPEEGGRPATRETKAESRAQPALTHSTHTQIPNSTSPVQLA